MRFINWLIGLGAVLFALFYDHKMVFWMEAHRTSFLNEFMLFLTDFGMLLGLIFFVVALFEKKLTKQLILLVLALGSAIEASHLLKMIFKAPRPYQTWDITPLTEVSGYSFPSMHATFIFAALPFFLDGRRRFFAIWTLFATLVAWSRVYVGVHYVSDVLVGGMLGYGIGYGLWALENHYGLTQWVLDQLKDKFEVRRQILHAFVGLSIIGGVQLGLLTPGVILIGLTAGGVTSIVASFVNIPGLRIILDYFERPGTRHFLPGRGAFMMGLGSLLVLLLFPHDIALAAIAIMALGDSVSHVVGRYFGEIYLPYNSKKTLDGVLMGMAAGTLGAFFFVPFHVALGASVVAMLVESFDINLGFAIDDNILVPLTAAGMMMMMLG